MDQSVERWLPVVGYEGFYEVSSHGRVRSIDRELLYADGRVCVWKGRILRQSLSAHKYPKVALSKNCVQQTLCVHRLVLAAFVGPRPDGMEGCHNDGNPMNNHFSNLRWDTPISNNRDKEHHGTAHVGSRCASSVLTEKKVLEIRRRFRGHVDDGGSNAVRLAQEFGVTPSTIMYVVRRRTWKHV